MEDVFDNNKESGQSVARDDYFERRKEKARAIYDTQKSIRNPYLETEVIFSSDGLHHLQFSARRERNKKRTIA